MSMSTETSNARGEWKEWMSDREQVVGLADHLEQVGWRQDERGDVQCFDQGAAMAAEVIRFVLLPMLDAPPPAAARGDVRGLPQPFGYVEPRHDLSGYEVFDEPGPRRAAIWNLHGMQQALAQQPAAVGLDPPVERQRDMLAQAIRDAAVKAGIARADADMTGPMLLMLCNDLADCALATQHQEPTT